MVLVAHIHATFNLAIHWRHDVPYLKSDSTNFNEVFLLQSIARHFHACTTVVPYYSPNFFLRLLLENLIYHFIDIVSVEDPVRPILVHQTSNDLIRRLRAHLFLQVLKVLIVAQLCVNIRLTSIETMMAFDFELFLFKELALALLDLEVEETVGLARPGDCPDVDLGQLEFVASGLRGRHLLEPSLVLVRRIASTPALNHFALA